MRTVDEEIISFLTSCLLRKNRIWHETHRSVLLISDRITSQHPKSKHFQTKQDYQKMDILELAVGTVPITQNATYSCVLTNTWSGARHPIDYFSVSRRAHWTPPVLLAHSRSIDLWHPGDFASPGVELVAELGSTPTLEDTRKCQYVRSRCWLLVVIQLCFTTNG